MDDQRVRVVANHKRTLHNHLPKEKLDRLAVEIVDLLKVRRPS